VLQFAPVWFPFACPHTVPFGLPENNNAITCLWSAPSRIYSVHEVHQPIPELHPMLKAAAWVLSPRVGALPVIATFAIADPFEQLSKLRRILGFLY